MTGPIVPLLITLDGDNVDGKLKRFFATTSSDYQFRSILLWVWRSELSMDAFVPEPIELRTNGAVSREEWMALIAKVREIGAAGVVFCAVDVMLRVGLDQDFIQELRTQGLEVWTSESVFPVPAEELSLV